MDEATQGRLYNSNLVLSPEPGCANTPHRGNIDQSQENNDILEFLIKTEMEDAVSAETAGEDGVVHSEAPPSEGVPMGWRRMSECSYKSRQASQSVCVSSSLAQFISSTANNFLLLFLYSECRAHCTCCNLQKMFTSPNQCQIWRRTIYIFFVSFMASRLLTALVLFV